MATNVHEEESQLRATVTECDDSFIFRLSDVAPGDLGAIQADYYTPDGDGYTKTFSRNAPYIDDAAANFVRYAEQLYGETLTAGSNLWREGLLHFLDTMEGSGIGWFLIGSCVLAVKGLDVVPRGVDVVFPQVSDLPRVRDLFGPDTFQPLMECEGWVAAAYGEAFHGCRISMAFMTQNCLDTPEPDGSGPSDSGPYAASHLETAIWEGREVPVPPMQLLLNINRRRGRTERVRQITEYLSNP
jgi:hypothetical protein